VAQTPPQAIKVAKKEPIFLRISVRVTGGGMDNSDLFRGKDALAECVFTVTLLKRAAVLDGHADEELERVAVEDRRKFIRLQPNPVFVVTKHYDTRFGAMWKQVLILLDREDTHRRNGTRCAFLSKGTILAKGYFLVGVERFEAALFFGITLKPDVAIRVQVSESLQEGVRIFFVEIESAHN
jgi:hypothetical protein